MIYELWGGRQRSNAELGEPEHGGAYLRVKEKKKKKTTLFLSFLYPQPRGSSGGGVQVNADENHP